MTTEEWKFPKAEDFVIKDSVAVQGITEDYVWYNAEKLLLEMGSWELEFKRVVRVMESRHKEHLKMIGDLLDENKDLRNKLKEKENG
jgi:hypothetical protein